MVHLKKTILLLPALVMAVTGCATKDWVRDLMGKKEVEIGQRMDGLGEEIKTTQANLDETSQVARGAGERADAAMTRAGSVDGRLTHLWSNRYNQKAVDSLEVYFGFDRADLSDGAETALLGVSRTYVLPLDSVTITVSVASTSESSRGVTVIVAEAAATGIVSVPLSAV